MKNSGLFIFCMIACSFVIAQPNLTDSLIVFYPFNGNANDLSPNGNNATIHGATLTADRFGVPNSAYAFDGIDDYIDCGVVLDPSMASGVSISGWFYPQAIVPTGNRYVGVSIGSKSNGELGIRVQDENFNSLEAILADGNELSTNGNNTGNKQGNGTLVYEDWIHVVGVFTSSSVQLYVNNVAYNNVSSNGTGGKLNAVPAMPLLIGKAFNSGMVERFFHGYLDDIRLYNRVLDSNDVAALFADSVSTSVAYHERPSGFSLKCTPNPATGSIQISLNNGLIHQIRIVDVTGRFIYGETVNDQPSTVISFAEHNMQSGTYIVEVGDDLGRIYRNRIVVQ